MSDQAVVTLKDVDVEFHGKTRSVHAVDHVD
ncbi:metal ion ABC transporter ATPase, partial [Lacticaseibacillus paracasei subsp. paracasei CNCM I-4270]